MDSYNIFLCKQDSMFVMGKLILEELQSIRKEIKEELKNIRELLTQYFSYKKLQKTSPSTHISLLPRYSVDDLRSFKTLKKLSLDPSSERASKPSSPSPSGSVACIITEVGNQSKLSQHDVLSQPNLSPDFSCTSDDKVVSGLEVYLPGDKARCFSATSESSNKKNSAPCNDNTENEASDNLSEDENTSITNLHKTQSFCESLNNVKLISENFPFKQSEGKLIKSGKYHGVMKKIAKRGLNLTTPPVTKHARVKQPCYICGKYRMYLARHMRIHTGEKPHKCLQCDKRFIDKGKLSNHMRTHTGERPFVCLTCGKTFGQQVNLRKHQLTHDPEGKHPCKYCGRCFPKNVALQNHILSHTGEKHFQCNKCYRSYSTRWSLSKHVQTNHTKLANKQFECEYCQKRFRSHGDLARHLLIHTGEKPFQCIQCGKSFRLQGTLKTHSKVHNKKW